MIGESPAFKAVLSAIDRIAPHDVCVLLEGETGTGKELVARAIHYRSRRRSHPFVPINCGALPEQLVENELFGHRRGAFTDARDDLPGLIEVAKAGTLFLDEVDALPLRGQVALLRFLQDQSYRPLGQHREAHADVRIVAASNRDVAQLAERGLFRADLLYRLELLHLRIPPLRERRGDPLLLAHHFAALAAQRFQMTPRPLAPGALAWMDRYAWPGNVRQLENLVYRACLLCEGDELRIPSPAAGLPATEGLAARLKYREAKTRAIAAFEETYLREAMASAGGNVSQAARLIGTERRHLGRLLRKHGLDRRG